MNTNPHDATQPPLTPSGSNVNGKRFLIALTVLVALFAGLYLENKFSVITQVKVATDKVLSPSELPTVSPDENFTIIVLPDTQIYARQYPDTFCDQTNWIVEQIQKLNIVFVSQMGDVTDDGSDNKQWDVAEKCMSILDGKIPYSVIPGNHDTDEPHRKESGMTKFNERFPSSKYINEPWYVAHFKDNENNAQLIKAMGVDMLFINLEIEPSDESLAWAKTVIDKYPNIYTVVTTHKYLPDDSENRNNNMHFSNPETNNTGEQIWQKLIKDNCQIKMVWNGHYHSSDGENRITSKNACDQDVEQVLQDYQERREGGYGLLRIYTFNPTKKIIEVSTYSPLTKQFENDESSRFFLPFAI